MLVNPCLNKKIGFVSIKNRIIVSLSRAKYGLFIIGNSFILKQKDEWYPVINHFQEKNIIFDHIPLKCPNHPEDEGTKIKTEDDFRYVKYGGCDKKCTFQRECGHTCTYRY
jgi:hypothetical protein